jgi:hypothetical protein
MVMVWPFGLLSKVIPPASRKLPRLRLVPCWRMLKLSWSFESASRPLCGFWRIDDQQLEI